MSGISFVFISQGQRSSTQGKCGSGTVSAHGRTADFRIGAGNGAVSSPGPWCLRGGLRIMTNTARVFWKRGKRETGQMGRRKSRKGWSVSVLSKRRSTGFLERWISRGFGIF